MNTSNEAVRRLQQARELTSEAAAIIADLIAPHDYQDVAALVTQAAEALLQAATHLMHADDEAAFAAIELADDHLEAVFEIVNADMDEL